MTPFQEEDPWAPKVISKWFVQLGLIVSFIYLSYRSYLIYQALPNDVGFEITNVEDVKTLLFLSINGFILFILGVSRVWEYYRGDS